MLATASLIVLFLAGAALAGTFQYMKVGGHLVPLSGCNNLEGNPQVEGEYVPDDPGNSVSFQWQLNALGWHSFSAFQNAGGIWGFSFTMSDSPGSGDDTLEVEANDDGTPYFWNCVDHTDP